MKRMDLYTECRIFSTGLFLKQIGDGLRPFGKHAYPAVWAILVCQISHQGVQILNRLQVGTFYHSAIQHAVEPYIGLHLDHGLEVDLPGIFQLAFIGFNVVHERTHILSGFQDAFVIASRGDSHWFVPTWPLDAPGSGWND